MDILKYFQRKIEKSSAQIAKERLQIIISHQNKTDNAYLQNLKQELLDVIAKYIPSDKRELVKVELENNNDLAVLELNITLPN